MSLMCCVFFERGQFTSDLIYLFDALVVVALVAPSVVELHRPYNCEYFDSRVLDYKKRHFTTLEL